MTNEGDQWRTRRERSCGVEEALPERADARAHELPAALPAERVPGRHVVLCKVGRGEAEQVNVGIELPPDALEHQRAEAQRGKVALECDAVAPCNGECLEQECAHSDLAQ